MSSRYFTVVKLAVLLTTILMVGLGSLWVLDILATEVASDYAVKVLGVMGIFTIGMLVVAALGGGPAGNGSTTES